MFRPNWNRYGGAAAAAVGADLLDTKARPLSARMTNSELLALGLLLADAFQYRIPFVSNYMGAAEGAADWASGMLAAGLARRHITPPVVALPAKPTFQAGTAGVVPAASASAAADLSSGY